MQSGGARGLELRTSVLRKGSALPYCTHHLQFPAIHIQLGDLLWGISLYWPANNILKRYIYILLCYFWRRNSQVHCFKIKLKVQSHYCIYLSIQLLPVSTDTITVPKDVKMVSHYISTFSPAFTNFLISSLEMFYSRSYEKPYYILPSKFPPWIWISCGHLCSPHS